MTVAQSAHFCILTRSHLSREIAPVLKILLNSIGGGSTF
jgi:hypothetical protein